ncbi:MAG: hypothetical protein KatS3mg106_563 [Gemmataceae bacterium]|jgi:hypothetical protein|nr:MAG: hypothetical protein KatS3mg106_563 [Gemmataceae bacterium]
MVGILKHCRHGFTMPRAGEWFPHRIQGAAVVRSLVADLHAEVDAVNPQLVLDEEGTTGCRRTPC